MSHRRPQSLQRILAAVSECEFVDEILLSNNNPEICLSDWVSLWNARAPHGVAGHLYGCGAGAAGEAVGVFSKHRFVDFLIWAYAYTKQNVTDYFGLLRGLGGTNRALRWNEAVPLKICPTQTPVDYP